MTAEAAAGPAVDITGLPSWTLDERQLGDTELLLMGAFAPLTGFLGPSGEAHGRPVGVAIDASGALLVADDVGNTVWRVSPR